VRRYVTAISLLGGVFVGRGVRPDGVEGPWLARLDGLI